MLYERESWAHGRAAVGSISDDGSHQAGISFLLHWNYQVQYPDNATAAQKARLSFTTLLQNRISLVATLARGESDVPHKIQASQHQVVMPVGSEPERGPGSVVLEPGGYDA